jgi:hypothetical protein
MLGVKNGAGLTSNYVTREDGTIKEPEMPTNTLVGSIERIEVYRARIERGESIFHPGDNTHVHVETVDRKLFRRELRKVKVAPFKKKHWREDDDEPRTN